MIDRVHTAVVTGRCSVAMLEVRRTLGGDGRPSATDVRICTLYCTGIIYVPRVPRVHKVHRSFAVGTRVLLFE